MSEIDAIPDDIHQKARDFARLAGQNYIAMGPMGFIEPIARAIQEEREANSALIASLSLALQDAIAGWRDSIKYRADFFIHTDRIKTLEDVLTAAIRNPPKEHEPG